MASKLHIHFFPRRQVKTVLPMIPADVRIRLMIRAQQRFPNKKLTPTIGCRQLSDGFRIEDGEYRFWFNTPDHSTHIIREQIISCKGDRSGHPVIQPQQEEQ